LWHARSSGRMLDENGHNSRERLGAAASRGESAS
jgi:hypothetical protein